MLGLWATVDVQWDQLLFSPSTVCSGAVGAQCRAGTLVAYGYIEMPEVSMDMARVHGGDVFVDNCLVWLEIG